MTTKTAYEQGMYAALEKYAAHLPDGEKQAFIAKLLRTLATPVEQAPLGIGRAFRALGIEKTPEMLLKSRGPAELQALENKIRGGQQTHIHGNIYKALKAMKVDKLYQKMEPFTGSTSEPHIRAQYGDRNIWSLAHQPLQHLLSAPVQYMAGKLPIVGPAAKGGVVNMYNTGRAGLEKLFGVPGPLPYGSTPSGALAAAPATPALPGPMQHPLVPHGQFPPQGDLRFAPPEPPPPPTEPKFLR